MKDNARGRRPTFTLIELLVVIAIIAILASMLLPSLQSAKGRAKRVHCLGNIKSLALSCLMYAGDHDQHLPTSNYDAGSSWAYNFDARRSTVAPRIPMGLGLLYGDYVERTPSLYHCPSAQSNPSYTNHCLDAVSGWGRGMSSFDDSTYTGRIIVGYTYRYTSWSRANGNAALTLSQGDAATPLVMDMLDCRFGRLFVHRNGYTVAAFDGHAAYIKDCGGLDSMMPTLSDGFTNAAGTEAQFTVIGKRL